jgi:ketol-acid reductoisomerase
MTKQMELKVQELSSQYNISSEVLMGYADEGCKICYKSSLKDYLANEETNFSNERDIEEFLEIIIATGMTEHLHDVVNKSPFKKIKFPKP